MITYHSCSTNDELLQILKLQQQNLPTSISESNKSTEGFVTVHHTLNLLKRMNDACAHTIAKDGSLVVGYALSMHPKFRNKIEVLKPMFTEINHCLEDPSTALRVTAQHKNYIVMGQVCIASAYRKKGVFRKLYEHMKNRVIPPFSYIITEVDSKNMRSLQAHYAIGFQQLKTYRSGGQDWELIYLQ